MLPFRQVLDINRFAIGKFYKPPGPLAGFSKSQVNKCWEEVCLLWWVGNAGLVSSQAVCKTSHPRKDALVKRMSLFKQRFRGPYRMNIQTTGGLISKPERFPTQFTSKSLHRGEMFAEIGCPVRSEPLDRERISECHSILVIYYHMLTTGEAYQEKGGDYFSERDRQEAERRLTKQLERLGYQVTLTPAQTA